LFIQVFFFIFKYNIKTKVMFKKFFKKTNSPSTRKSFNFLDFNNLGYSDQGTITAGVDTYLRNVIVYRCVNLISQTASHVPWKIFNIEAEGLKNLYFNLI
jgi:phage portal protein BeeE